MEVSCRKRVLLHVVVDTSESGEISRLSSESAPIPIPWNAAGNDLLDLGLSLAGTALWRGSPATAAVRARAVGPGLARAAPRLVVVPAAGAGASRGALWVEAGVLVEGNVVDGVRGAEDVAAAAAVMTTDEQGELRITGHGIAQMRGGVGLAGQVSGQSRGRAVCSDAYLPVVAGW